MKTAELRKLNKDKLEEHVAKSEESLFKFKIQRVNGNLSDHSVFSKLRKSIARAKTILKEMNK